MKSSSVFKSHDVSEAGLLSAELCFSLISIFIGVFLTAQIFVLSGESFVTLGLFSTVNFIFIFISQIVGGYICKKIGSVVVLRLSAIFSLLLLILILNVYDDLIEYYMLLSLIWGSILGFNFSASQFLIAKKTTGEKMLRFIATYTSLVSVIQLIFPATFGFIIQAGNFFFTTVLMVVFVISQIISTFFITEEAELEDKKLQFVNFWSDLKKADHVAPSIKLWLIIFLTGFADLKSKLILAFVMLAFNSYLNLGLLISVFAVIKIFVPQLYRKSEKSRKMMFSLAVILPLISVFVIVISGNLYWVVLLMGVHNITRGLIYMEEEKTRLSATSYWTGGKKYVMESNLFYETALTAGAVIASLSLILAGFFYTQTMTIILLVITVCSFSLHGALVKSWQKKYAQNKVTA